MDELTTAARAQWLAEVSDTLAQARTLLERMGRQPDTEQAISELSTRIATAQIVARALRLRHQRRRDREIDPNWINRRRKEWRCV